MIININGQEYLIETKVYYSGKKLKTENNNSPIIAKVSV